jgi:galactokinase/mevalonate kinase-like predicted kinase
MSAISPASTSSPPAHQLRGRRDDFPHYFEEHGGAVLSTTIDHHVRVSIAPRDDRQVIVRRSISAIWSSTTWTPAPCTTG